MVDRRIAIAGWYGHDNAGDELILENLVRLYSPVAVFSDIEYRFREYEVHHLDSITDRQESFDILLVGGGGLLNISWVSKLPLLQMSKPYGFYAVGIVFEDWLNGLEPYLQKASFISLRDHRAIDTLRRKFGDRFPTFFLPDPGFMTEAADRSTHGDRVILNLRHIPPRYLDKPKLLKAQVKAFNRLIGRNPHLNFLGLGFQDGDKELLEKLDCDHRIVDHEQAIYEISGSSCCICTRLHAAIISATQGVPFLMVSYQDKVRGLAELLQLEEFCVDLGEIKKIEAAFRELPAFPGERVRNKISELV